VWNDSARRGFQQQARSSENTKSIKTLGGWGPHWGAYTAPQLQALPKPHPALSSSGWGEVTEGPPSYCWTGAPQSLATPLCALTKGRGSRDFVTWKVEDPLHDLYSISTTVLRPVIIALCTQHCRSMIRSLHATCWYLSFDRTWEQEVLLESVTLCNKTLWFDPELLFCLLVLSWIKRLPLRCTFWPTVYQQSYLWHKLSSVCLSSVTHVVWLNGKS